MAETGLVTFRSGAQLLRSLNLETFLLWNLVTFYFFASESQSLEPETSNSGDGLGAAAGLPKGLAATGLATDLFGAALAGPVAATAAFTFGAAVAFAGAANFPGGAPFTACAVAATGLATGAAAFAGAACLVSIAAFGAA